MKNQFFCQSCQLEFEAEGKKLEYVDRLYGPCWKLVAACPNCKIECDEARKTSSSRKTVDLDSYAESLRNSGGKCGPGGGCCG